MPLQCQSHNKVAIIGLFDNKNAVKLSFLFIRFRPTEDNLIVPLIAPLILGRYKMVDEIE
jgi:hypothetical protein